MQDILAIASGGIVGFSLGLIGGGGSILAVPLLFYVAGVGDAHVAIGTSALAVAANAFANLLSHARGGHVRWPSAILFACVGVVGAVTGSTIGKGVDGRQLLALFAVLMIVIAVLMQRRRQILEGAAPVLSAPVVGKLGVTGFGVGALAGFFGIGGGFLIVPGLIFASGMATIDAIGSSLLAVSAFSLVTAGNYAASGLLVWHVAAECILGGIGGGLIGARLAMRLSRNRMLLNRMFGGVLAVVAVYILIRSIYMPETSGTLPCDPPAPDARPTAQAPAQLSSCWRSVKPYPLHDCFKAISGG
jgi:uncharacterized protein